MRSTEQPVSIAIKTRCDSAIHIQALAAKCLRNTPNFRCFQDDLYQAEPSKCSALQRSRLQSLTHPYSPLKNHAVFRINRNPGLGIWPYPNKSFGMKFSGCSALPESRRQSLPHPYSPLGAPAFFRISRNRVQASNPHLNESFGMNSSFIRINYSIVEKIKKYLKVVVGWNCFSKPLTQSKISEISW